MQKRPLVSIGMTESTKKGSPIKGFPMISYGGTIQNRTGEWRFCRPLPYRLAMVPLFSILTSHTKLYASAMKIVPKLRFR